jgi:hypothetical protein
MKLINILEKPSNYEQILSEFDKEITKKLDKLSQFEFLTPLRYNQTVEQIAKQFQEIYNMIEMMGAKVELADDYVFKNKSTS